MPKVCFSCKKSKPFNLFSKNKKIKDGFHTNCKECCAKKYEQFKIDNPGHMQAYRKRYKENNTEAIADRAHKYRHGIGKEEVLEMLNAQGGCKVCGATEPGGTGYWHVDHDHNCCGPRKSCTKCRRGVLCNACNLMLGHAKDNIEVLEKAINYLANYEREKNGQYSK